jgi:hypothetical protein
MNLKFPSMLSPVLNSAFDIVACICDYRWGLDWWIDLLTTYAHGTTSNYSAIANLHTSQITTASAKYFPACCVFTSLSLATASNSGDSSASHAQVLSSQPSVRNSILCLTELCPLLITSQHGPHTEHRSSIVAFVPVAAENYLLSRCSEMTESRTTGNNGLLLLCACIYGRYLTTASV